MTNKEKYILFLQSENVPIFSQSWWLDATAFPENWDVILIEKENKIIASFPYYIRKRNRIVKGISMPFMTQKMGPYIKYHESQSEDDRLSYEKKIMTEIIEKLPFFDFFVVTFDYRYKNWLPFYWKGFKQTTGYTYVIPDISDVDTVFSNFDRSKKKNINKSQKEVSIHFDLPCKIFYENHVLSLQKQGQKIAYSFEQFERIYTAAYENNQGRVIYCKDEKENIHAALFVVWDNHSAYDLISTIDPTYRNSGAASLLVYEMIKYLSGRVKVFDFEGSMIEGVENSFRKFGTVQKSLLRIIKFNSKKMKLLKVLNETKNLILNKSDYDY